MLYMSKMEYTAPEMDVIEFGNEDVCTSSKGWTPDGDPSHGFGVKEETDETDGDF